MTSAKKNENSMLRLALVLFLISAATALLLGLVDYITRDRIAAQKAEKTNAALAEVMPEGESFDEAKSEVSAKEITHIYVAQSGGERVGYVFETVVSGSQGNIDMVVGVGLDGAVTGVAIVEMSETSNLGSKAADEEWRAQFTGVSTEQAVSKDGGEIDALTGATVTSRAVTNGVNIALAAFAELD